MPPKKKNIAKALSQRQQRGRQITRVAEQMVSQRVLPAITQYEDQIQQESRRVETRSKTMASNYVMVEGRRMPVTVEQKADMVRANAIARRKIERLQARKTDASGYFWKLQSHYGPPPPPPPGSVGFA